jgi:hypothetical protein
MAFASHAVTRGRRCAALGALAAVLASQPARAADPFEIQVYDGTANEPGHAGLELHTNYVARGLGDAPPLLATDKVFHMTLEPSYGVLPWWELGGYFQTALRPDGTLDYAGVKLRSKFVTPESWSQEHGGWRFGMNWEVSRLPETYDADRWGGELRPIAAWEDERWAFAFNPIVSTPFAGEGFKKGPTLEPAVMGFVKVGHAGLGLEYYSSLGPIASPLPLREQEHYLFEVFNLVGVEKLEVNFGVGEGLTDGSNGFVIKSIVGYSF